VPKSSETYRALAASTGYRIESLEKVVRLGELLSEMDGEDDLRGKIALRGGTALNLEQSSPPRLSVDIDLDYVGGITREDMLRDQPDIIAMLERIARSLNYRVTKSAPAHSGTTLTLGYSNAASGSDSVKLDVSWTNRVGIEPRRRAELWQPEGLSPVEFTLVGRADLVAGKFRALIDRVAARDVFDAVRIAQAYGESWPSSSVRNAFVFLCGTLDHPLTDYTTERLDRLTEEDYRNNLLPMLAPGSVSSHKELIVAAKLALAPLLELDEVQQEFVASLDRGELKPELLFSEEAAQRLALHPHLRWKAQNRRDHLNRKS
jgi:predicted nucleotidyltransferase component of viral defense system